MAVKLHPLTVGSIERLTPDSVAITLLVPDALSESFAHVSGQHVLLRTKIDGEDVRRSYSISSPTSARDLTVGVKHLPGGLFSSYANTRLEPGDVLEVSEPTGDFTIVPDEASSNHYVAIVAGSGITPVLSMIGSVLPAEPESRFTLVFGNRDGLSVMFLDQLDALKNRFPDRLAVFHILSRETNAIPLFEGRIDADKLRQLFSTVVDAGTATSWYLCGPAGLVSTARRVLANGGVPEGAIHDELFYAGDDGPPVVARDDAVGSKVRFTLVGRSSTVVVDPDGAPILDHVLSVRPDGPFSCRSGACASCRAQVTKGTVVMDRNWSLNKEEVDSGQILTCQAHPVSDEVELTYDL